MRWDWHTAFIGIGGNIGDSEQKVLNAIDLLDQHPKCQVMSCSSLYETEPVDFTDQPNFINAVIKISTRLDRVELLNYLWGIETVLGRVRTGQVNGPRVIDLDLLLYDNETYESEELVLPHPRMHERRFVLEPLVEIEPDITIPNRGRGAELLAACVDQEVAKLSNLKEN